MAQNRHPKRQRKKEAAAARRQAQAEALRRRARRRIYFLVATMVLLGLGGTALAFYVAQRDPDVEVTPTPTPEETPPPEEEVACDGEVPPGAGEEKEMYMEAADQGLDPAGDYIWRLDTNCGVIDIRLDVERAPETTNSIAFLTRQGFFDGLTFHRVAPDFVIQGGDPVGTGEGGPGYQVVEAPPADLEYTQGIVAMAKTQEDPQGASGSQFFIVSGEQATLPPDFALVGEVVAGMEAVQTIEGLGEADGVPAQTIYIKSAVIIEED